MNEEEKSKVVKIEYKKQFMDVIIDMRDFNLVSSYIWRIIKKGRNFYAYSTNGNTMVYMHRVILGLKNGDGKIVDHVNRNGLDNRKINLRLCASQGNSRNSRKQNRKTTSKYKGVHWEKRSKSWQATIKYNNRCVHLGFYDHEIHAARAYDIAAEKYFKDYACGNNIDKRIVPNPHTMKRHSKFLGLIQENRGPTISWNVQIYHDGKIYKIGRYTDEEEAAVAYNRFARKIKGDKAKLNNVDETIPIKRIDRRSSSIYTGVSWNKNEKKWTSTIHIGVKKYFLGYFMDEKLATKAFNEKAIELLGKEEAKKRLNKIEE